MRAPRTAILPVALLLAYALLLGERKHVILATVLFIFAAIVMTIVIMIIPDFDQNQKILLFVTAVVLPGLLPPFVLLIWRARRYAKSIAVALLLVMLSFIIAPFIMPLNISMLTLIIIILIVLSIMLGIAAMLAIASKLVKS